MAKEANEFAGRLLVPKTKLRQLFQAFAEEIETIVPGFMASSELRDKFSVTVAPKFMVNPPDSKRKA